MRLCQFINSSLERLTPTLFVRPEELYTLDTEIALDDAARAELFESLHTVPVFVIGKIYEILGLDDMDVGP